MLTGPIGSGKSAVRKMLEDLGCVAIDSDSIGHSVLLPDGAAFDDVADRWPGVVADGAIDRRKLAEIVFSDPRELAELEAITHPAIAEEIARRVEQLDDFDVVVEIPLLDRIVPHGQPWHRLVVIADEDVRLERAIRRGMDRDDVQRRIRAQPAPSDWVAAADSVIVNDGDVDRLERAVAKWWSGQAEAT